MALRGSFRARMVLAQNKDSVGWREWIALPDLGIRWIKVKVDTGARSSALHAFDLQPFRRRGTDMIRFLIHPMQRDLKTTSQVEAPVLEWRPITNSGGKAELRPVIETTVRFQGEAWPIELTLTRRDVMGFRMLLGRQAIRGRYLVDPGRSFLGGRPERKKKSVKKRSSELLRKEP